MQSSVRYLITSLTVDVGLWLSVICENNRWECYSRDKLRKIWPFEIRLILLPRYLWRKDGITQLNLLFNRLDLGMLLQGKPTVDSDTASQQQFMSQLTKSSEALKNAIGVSENPILLWRLSRDIKRDTQTEIRSTSLIFSLVHMENNCSFFGRLEVLRRRLHPQAFLIPQSHPPLGNHQDLVSWTTPVLWEVPRSSTVLMRQVSIQGLRRKELNFHLLQRYALLTFKANRNFEVQHILVMNVFCDETKFL